MGGHVGTGTEDNRLTGANGNGNGKTGRGDGLIDKLCDMRAWLIDRCAEPRSEIDANCAPHPIAAITRELDTRLIREQGDGAEAYPISAAFMDVAEVKLGADAFDSVLRGALDHWATHKNGTHETETQDKGHG